MIIKLLVEKGNKKVPKEYWVRWAHDHELKFTVCSFLDPKTGKAIYEGIGSCNPKDVFSKKSGRKYSLKSLLSNTEFDKNQRRAIWSSYLDMMNGKWR